MQPSSRVDLPTLEQVLDRSPLIVQADTTLQAVIALMGEATNLTSEARDPRISSCVLVVEPSHLVGILTVHDVIRFMANRMDYTALPVSEVMTQPVIALPVATGSPALVALSLMRQHQIRHLPVIDELGNPVGLITQKSLLQAFDPIRWIEGLQSLQGLAQAQTQWQATQEELEQRVARRTAELVLANAYLRQRESQWQGLFDNALDAIAITDDAGYYTDVNPAACALLGVAREELIGLRVADFSDPALDFDQLWTAFLQSGQLSGEYRVYRRDGTVRDVEFNAVANFIPHRHLSILRDISDRKQAEMALQQQLAREQLIAEITHSIRQTLDVNEVLQRTVDQVRHILQTDRVIIFRFRSNWQGEVVTESVDAPWTAILSTIISDPCFSDRYIEPYRQGRISTITNLHTEAIEPCYVELLAHFQVQANLVVPILHSDQLWGLLIAHHCASPRQWQPEEIELLRQLANQVGIAIYQSELYQQTRHELLERQRIQDALQESEERFRSLSTSAPIGILQMNADGICLYANARWQVMTGLQAADCLGNGWMQPIHPEDRPMIVAAWEKMLQQQQECACEFRVLTPQNQVRWIAAHAAPMRSTTGKIIGYVSTQIDITERKQAEVALEEKRQLEAQFYRAQRLESLGTLASGIAHDLNNVFTPILVLSQILTQKFSHLDPRSREILETIQGSARHGSELIQQILTFTRGTEGKCITVQVRQLLLETVKVIEQTFPKSIAIHPSIPPQDLWLIEADPTQVQQVVMNLCVNARDAMPDGGTLTISVENHYVHSRVARLNLDARVGNYVLITVADTGSGMSPELLDRIFDPFFTTKDPGRGTGLGLATVLGIVKKHGGFLQVFSQVGHGSQFKVYLPAQQPERTK
ncbi:PAS domain S-box protein [Pantanalinema rosaneae CENA516]|uniref:PAS domain S-box protein n=1 Tax=Pantanalinema rosaneae TaxID=1620701 RepID=UPI003D6FB023